MTENNSSAPQLTSPASGHNTDTQRVAQVEEELIDLIILLRRENKKSLDWQRLTLAIICISQWVSQLYPGAVSLQSEEASPADLSWEQM